MGWLFLLLGVLAEATSHVALKATNGFSNFWPSAIVIFGHLLAFLFLGQAVKNLPVGIVHASWAGLATKTNEFQLKSTDKRTLCHYFCARCSDFLCSQHS